MLWNARVSRNSLTRSRQTIGNGWTKWELGNFLRPKKNMLDNWFAHFIAIRCLKYKEERPKNKSRSSARLLCYFIVSERERERKNCHCVRSAHVFASSVITVCFHVFILIRTSTSMMYYYCRCHRRRHCVSTRCFTTFSPRRAPLQSTDELFISKFFFD